MIFSIQPRVNKFVQTTYEKAMHDLNRFFEMHWNECRPQVILIPNRKTFNGILDHITDDWVIGSSVEDQIVFFLDPKNFEKESCHTYSKESYRALIYHELCHCFLKRIIQGGFVPKWLNEGMSLFFANQIKEKKRPKKFQNFLKFYDHFSYEIYEESGFAVELLMKKFGKKKFLFFLQSLSKVQSKKEFDQFFEKVFNIRPTFKTFNEIYLSLP
jgi:hypothetical protein